METHMDIWLKAVVMSYLFKNYSQHVLHVITPAYTIAHETMNVIRTNIGMYVHNVLWMLHARLAGFHRFVVVCVYMNW